MSRAKPRDASQAPSDNSVRLFVFARHRIHRPWWLKWNVRSNPERLRSTLLVLWEDPSGLAQRSQPETDRSKRRSPDRARTNGSTGVIVTTPLSTPAVSASPEAFCCGHILNEAPSFSPTSCKQPNFTAVSLRRVGSLCRSMSLGHTSEPVFPVFFVPEATILRDCPSRMSGQNPGFIPWENISGDNCNRV